jgi:hypothetical protein
LLCVTHRGIQPSQCAFVDLLPPHANIQRLPCFTLSVHTLDTPTCAQGSPLTCPATSRCSSPVSSPHSTSNCGHTPIRPVALSSPPSVRMDCPHSRISPPEGGSRPAGAAWQAGKTRQQGKGRLGRSVAATGLQDRPRTDNTINLPLSQTGQQDLASRGTLHLPCMSCLHLARQTANPTSNGAQPTKPTCAGLDQRGLACF